ncbi:MAG: D-tyrosyl-tRNA(Tyr) deacylase [Clostridia bacterium]|nr:D-tyrosyl-tRNA(Tyr) deacylase [Clostridia bacterium]
MRCVVQRVTQASVTVEGERVSEIGAGFLVLVGADETDDASDAKYCADKIAGLRVFEDENDKMNLSVKDVGGSVLLVSQFTLLGDARHGRRPSFSHAARPEIAEPLCDTVRDLLRAQGIPTCTGRFRTHMVVDLTNDGPVTILLDSKRGF